MDATLHCPKCGRENSSTAHFCTTCHQVLIHRCPKCWHEQRQEGSCEKCGLDMDAYWKTYAATKAAALVAEERTNMERSSSQAASFLESLAAWPYGISAVLRSLVARFLLSRIPWR
jgi:uncharacterized membrane protein YvbJ